MGQRFLLLFLTFISTLIFAQDKKLEKISVQLKWKHQFQFAGFYMAKEKGFYNDAGLDVTLVEYKHGENIVDNVLGDNCEYGVGYPSIILDKTQRKEIVLLKALLQSSPHVLVSVKSSGIRSIEDFKGKKIMIADSATYTASFISMLRSHGLDMSDMNRLEPSFEMQSLINQEADLSSAYRTNEVYELEQRGVEFSVWDPKNYGFDFYDDILFTSQDELQKHPERVAKFIEATLKGFEYAYSHKDESINLIQKKYNTQKRTKEALLYEAKNLEELAYVYKKPLGDIDPIKIQRIIDIYNLFGRIKEPVDLDEFIYKPQNKFMLTQSEKKYLENKKSITMCVDPDWMPFEKIQNGKHLGMSADYFELLQKKLPVAFELVETKTWEESMLLARERKCDILSLVMKTPEREKYFSFTKPYIKMPVVIATKMDAPFIADFRALKNKKIGIAKGYAYIELLHRDYPNLEIVEVDNLNDGLQKVVDGVIYGYVGNLATVGYNFQKNFTGELKISGKFDDSWDLGIGVRNDDPVLLDILDKTVQSIDEKEKEKIINSWLTIKYEKSVDYELLLKVIAFFGLLLLFVLLFYFRERTLKKAIQINQILLEEIIKNIPNPMFFKDREGVFKNVNSAFSKDILGVDEHKVIGKRIDEFASELSQEVIELHKKQDELLYEDHVSKEYESEFKMQDGSMKEFKVTQTVFRSNEGECLGYIGVMMDITEHKVREKKLKKLASTDPLTKLYNRRYFSKMANHLLDIAKRHDESMTLLMIDIDDFKPINDTYGHKVGDNVIIAISNVLSRMSRKSDIVARFGGEEFVILLPKTNIVSAAIMAEKIRAKISGLALNIQGVEQIQFTISLGISEIDAKSEKDIEPAIKRADDALYEAKNSGKNKVCRA